VQGFLISESSWAIEYVIVETHGPQGARRIIVLPSWIESIDGSQCAVRLDVGRQVVLAGPEFTEDIQAAYESWFATELAHQSSAIAH
jgi:hypothetical protein